MSVCDSETISIVVGMRLGQFTVIITDKKDTTVECSCGNIKTYGTIYLRRSNAARRCYDCSKTDMSSFQMARKPKGNFPTLSEEVSRAMIDNYIKDKGVVNEQDK